jgi:hypothetical protein
MLATATAFVLIYSAGLNAGPAPAQSRDHHVAATAFHVAPHGNDSISCRANSRRRPFRTIQRGADCAHTPGDTVVIASGVYRETVRPTASGTHGRPITFRPARGASVVVSGTEVVKGWTKEPYGTCLKSCWSAAIKRSRGEGRDQVFLRCGDPWARACKMLEEARWPNVGAGGPWHPKFAVAEDGSGDGETWTLTDGELPAKIGRVSPGAIVTYTNNSMFWGFVADSRVTAYDPKSKTIAFEHPVPNDNPAYDLPGRLSHFYLRDKKNFLDHRSEWYVDRSAGRLYVARRPRARVETKARTWAFNLNNRSYIHVTNIGIFGASITTAGSASHNVLNGIAGRFIYHDLNVKAFWDPAEFGGIVLGGTRNTIENSAIEWSSGNGILSAGKDNRVVNNSIFRVNYLGTDAPAIADLGLRSLIAYNTAGIAGKNTVDLYGSYAVVEHNDLCCNAAFSHDVGVVYVWGRANQIRYNWIHDAHDHGYASENNSNMALYLDGGSRDNLVYRNVVSNARGAGVGLWLTGQNFNEIYNNSFYDADEGFFVGAVPFAQFLPIPFVRDMWGTRIINNAFYETGNNSGTPTGEEHGLVMRTNVVARSQPAFADPSTGDFSPAGPLVDAGEEIPGITDGYTGAAPDVGAFERDMRGWDVGQRPDAPRARYRPIAGTPWTNRIRNAGFESPLPTEEPWTAIAPWTRTHGTPEQVAVVTETGEHSECGEDPEACGFRSGIFSLALRAGGRVRVKQRVSGLSPGAELCLVAWVRGTRGAAATLGADGIAETATTFESLKWREVRLPIDVPPSGEFTVFYVRPESTDGSVWLDDVGLAPTPDGFECNSAA